jgi:AcrR family transcriptional regulator
MPPAQYTREEVVDRLMAVVRRLGYAGASLAELSKATGLGKSSLYHYFPAGKDDMVRAVLDRLEAQLTAGLFAPLEAAGPPRRRLEAMVETLDAFYRGGEEACLLAQLALGGGQRFQAQLGRIFAAWLAAIASALRDAGLPMPVAQARAEDAVKRVQGALILASAGSDATAFERTLRRLPDELLASSATS